MSTCLGSSRISIARKNHQCYFCAMDIRVGQIYERWAGVTDGDFWTVKAHVECVAAVKHWTQEDYEDFTDAIDQPTHEVRVRAEWRQVRDHEWYLEVSGQARAFAPANPQPLAQVQRLLITPAVYQWQTAQATGSGQSRRGAMRRAELALSVDGQVQYVELCKKLGIDP